MKSEIGNSDDNNIFKNDSSEASVDEIPFFSRQIWERAIKYLIPLLIAAVVVGFLVYNNDKLARLNFFRTEQHSSVLISKDILSDDISGFVRNAKFYIEVMQTKNLFDTSGNIDPQIKAELTKMFLLSSDTFKRYDRIRVLDNDGMEVIRVDYHNGGSAVVSDAELQDKADRYYFTETIKLEPGKVFVSEMDLNVEQGQIELPIKPIIRIGTPIRNATGQTAGIFMLDYRADILLDHISLLEVDYDTHESMLLNAQGYWLLGPEADKEWGFMYPDRKSENFGAYYPTEWEEILSKDNGSFVTPNGSFSFQRIYPLAIEEVNFFDGANEYFWIWVSRIPNTVLSAANLNSLLTISVITILIVLLVACIIVLNLRSKHAILMERNNLKTLYRSVVDTQREIICRYLPDTTLTFVNDAYCRAFGKSRKELLGLKYLLFIPPELHEDELASLKRLTLAHPSDTREFEVIAPDGDTHWQEWTDVAIFNESGELKEIQGTGHDITERKLAEEETRRHRDRTVALLQASTRLNAHMEIRDIYRIVSEEVCSALKVPLSIFLRYDSKTRGFCLTEGSSLALELDRGKESLLWNGFGEVLMKSGKTGVVTDSTLLEDPVFERLIQKHDIKRLVYVVIEREGSTFGILVAGAREELTHSDDAIATLEGLARQTAAAITNVHLFDETQNRLNQVQALRNIDLAITGSLDLRVTFQVVLDEVTRMLKTDAAAILRLDPHSGVLKYEHWRGFRTENISKATIRLGEGHGGHVALDRQSIHIPDLREVGQDPILKPIITDEGFVAYYAVPLIAKGSVLGVLEVFHRELLVIDGEWLSFLETLAGQAAIAIDNAELFTKLERSNVELLRAYDATIAGWAHALDLKDDETENHSRRVTELTMRISRKLGIKEEEMAHVRRGALLHDIGKMGIPDKILLKAGKLTDDEWGIMRKHPVFAFEMLSPIEFLRRALDIPYCHHEKWDGSGYPRGLKGEQIPLAARIFAIVDVYDALTSDRPYRKAWSMEKTLKHIREQSGTHFDPQVVELFLQEI
ncbi:MAG: hypothetical protein CVV64_20660 [Candidatus Wallbacteria bacterium HGW-Wallbacteria-1]|jgi:PAS domain S-box-containing protein/putative nucleotidyltransferase with HDIG domain|uniref:Histidine kinase n=1 Tax=Candidatus Wallbacteria bacterium HGW-Wallbacteria-1 TaxID=2013854 RepID=A0A2N1PI44_9BACT|nr:MAG: hypothetical protein CVV64_20660 [Candidatus Wallbacteria bacterium HGW-Wallbacteria-1]PKL26877.1 MAG: hypothetical protein CVV46_14710 [Spirochaetae bacterium HGW-Spirochaetae-2]